MLWVGSVLAQQPRAIFCHRRRGACIHALFSCRGCCTSLGVGLPLATFSATPHTIESRRSHHIYISISSCVGSMSHNVSMSADLWLLPSHLMIPDASGRHREWGHTLSHLFRPGCHELLTLYHPREDARPRRHLQRLWHELHHDRLMVQYS